MIRVLCFGFALFWLCSAPAHAQPAPADSLFHLAQLSYDNGDFDNAELSALRGLREAASLDDLARLKFHLLLGFVYVARDQRNSALQEFTRVIEANPSYELDPVATSPKILDVFHEAKKSYMDRVLTEPAAYRLPQADVRLSASWRSLVLPGWGQFYKQQDVKGAALASAQALSLAMLIVMQLEVNSRHNAYLDKPQGDPTIDGAYQDYRRAYRLRNAVGYVTLGIYFINYMDALYYPVLHKR